MNNVAIKNHLNNICNKWLTVFTTEIYAKNKCNINNFLDGKSKTFDPFEFPMEETLDSYAIISGNLTNNDTNFLSFNPNISEIYIHNYLNKIINELKDALMISGGCITSLYLNEEVNDYDIYFTNKNIVNLILEFYLDKFNIVNGTYWKYDSNINKIYQLKKAEYLNIPKNELYKNLEQYTEVTDALVSKNVDNNEKKFEPICITPNAISLTNNVQLVTRFTGNPKEIISNFDFIHTNNYYKFSSNELITKKEAIESILAKQLIYNGSKYPICSLIRTRKFINRGWFISAGEYLKMAFQINKLNLMDINVLREQLIGVDAKYFIEFLNRLNDISDLNEIDIFNLLNEIFEEVGDSE